LQATLALAGIDRAIYAPAVEGRLKALTKYWDRRAKFPAYDSTVRPWIGRGGDKYHDDNVWLAHALVQCYRMGLVDSLTIPEQLQQFGHSGWDTRPNIPKPGGVFWVQQGVGYGVSNHDRGTGTTAGNAMLGFHLAELGASHPTDQARQMIAWVERYLSSTPDGAGPYWNALDDNGTVDTNLWSYNQGVVIAARVLEYRLTHDPLLLQKAETVARHTLATFGDFRNHPPAFNAMCFQEMLLLSSVTEDNDLKTRMRSALLGYADWTWDPATGARDPETDLFRFRDSGRPLDASQPAKLQDQGAIVHLYALLAWSPADYSKLG
jgi:hypothetical protein